MPPPTLSLETKVQDFVHALEQGRYVGIVRVIVTSVVVLAIALAYLGWNFRGFVRTEAMDQAQIAREISRGNGWSTKFIRPLAIWQIEKNKGAAPRGLFPDTYNAPLPPLVNSVAVKLSNDTTQLKRLELYPFAERMIVILSMLCFLGAVAVNYFLLKELFDRRLALFASGLALITDLFWQFTLSGLPQMLMLLLFSTALYALMRAIQAHLQIEAPLELQPPPESETGELVEQARPPNPTVVTTVWLAVAGIFFGLLALSHTLAVMIFVGAVIFSFVYFRSRKLTVIALIATFTLVYTPWLVRTYRVSGNPFGVAAYAPFDGVGSTTAVRMRSDTGPSTGDISPYFLRPKMEHGLANQFNLLGQNLGGSLVALAFFVSLLHGFRRPETSALRWAVLTMWICAILGMITLGVDQEPQVGPGQMGVLFLPVMLGFGLAFTLVIFGRWEANTSPLYRLGFFAVIFLITALPMIVTLLPERLPPHQFPPYFAPAINRLHEWTSDREIIGSDMPWAVAWYADRSSLWVPIKLRNLMSMSDDGKLNGTLAGVFLTPISRSEPFISGIYKGEYQEYAQLIFGNSNLSYFPFREAAFPLGDLNYTFYSDTRRWERHEPTP